MQLSATETQLSAARTNVNEPLIQKVSIYQKIGTSLKKNQNGNISPKMVALKTKNIDPITADLKLE